MAAPIEMIKGGERQTVYSEARSDALIADGWQRVRDLPVERQRELADLPPSPWNGYDDMTAQEVVAKSAGLPPERIKEVITYESATKGRVSVVDKLTGGKAHPQAQPPVTVETVLEQTMQTREVVEIVSADDVPAAPAQARLGDKGGRGVPKG